VVAPQPFYEDRGTPIAVRRLLEALSELAYNVDVLTYPVGRDLDLPGVRVLRTANPFGLRRVPIGLSLAKLTLDVPLAWALAARLRTRQYACVHALEEAAFPAVVLGRRYGVPVIYDMQSSLPEQLRRYPLLGSPLAQRVLTGAERWLLRNAGWVVSFAGLAPRVRTVTPDARAHEWRYPGLGHPDSPAAAAELRLRLGVPAGAPVVLYSGTFEPHQGLSLLLRAAALIRVQRPDVRFVLVGGNGEDAEVVRRQVAELGLPDVVRLIERQPRELMPSYLAMASVAVSTRTGGGNLPLKIFDYLAAGRPIVATDIAAHRAVLTAERAVLVTPEPRAMAEAITALLADRRRAARLADRARAYAASTLGWPAFVTSVRELYEEVIARPWAGNGEPSPRADAGGQRREEAIDACIQRRQ